MANLYWWNFNIKTVPLPPTGINEGSPPPSPETIGACNVELIDPQADGFDEWLWPGGAFVMTMAMAAVAQGILNTNASPWDFIIKQLGPGPTQSVPVAAIATWKQVFSMYNTGGEANHAVEVNTGVTTSEEKTQSFAAEVGLSVSAGFGGFDATMSASFTASAGSTRTIAFERGTRTTTEVSIPPNSFLQCWQLNITTQAGTQAITEAVPLYQSLSYPPTNPQVITAAQVREQLARAMSKRNK